MGPSFTVTTLSYIQTVLVKSGELYQVASLLLVFHIFFHMHFLICRLLHDNCQVFKYEIQSTLLFTGAWDQTVSDCPKYLYSFDFTQHLADLITCVIFRHSLFMVESANASLQKQFLQLGRVLCSSEQLVLFFSSRTLGGA